MPQRFEERGFSAEIIQELDSLFLVSRKRKITTSKLIIKSNYTADLYSTDIRARTRIVQRFTHGRTSAIEYSCSFFSPEHFSPPPAYPTYVQSTSTSPTASVRSNSPQLEYPEYPDFDAANPEDIFDEDELSVPLDRDDVLGPRVFD
jgi:hypothetical protein